MDDHSRTIITLLRESGMTMARNCFIIAGNIGPALSDSVAEKMKSCPDLCRSGECIDLSFDCFNNCSNQEFFFSSGCCYYFA